MTTSKSYHLTQSLVRNSPSENYHRILESYTFAIINTILVNQKVHLISIKSDVLCQTISVKFELIKISLN